MPRPSLMVDTWAWVALYNPADQYHQRARSVHEELVNGYDWITTNFILDETYTALRRWSSPDRAVRFGRRIRAIAATGALTVVTVGPDIETQAWGIFERYDTVRHLSYTDCTTFAVMQRLDVGEAFTGDGHFNLLGFVTRP